MQNSLSQFFAKIYGWTFLGLTISGAFAMWIASIPGIQMKLYVNQWIIFGLIVIQILFVTQLTSRINILSTTVVNIFYFIYAALIGVVFSMIFVTYQIGIIYTAFFIVAGMFLVMSIFSVIKKIDLSKKYSLLVMGFVGIIIAMCVNMFLQRDGFDFVISIISVIIFILLTAYDTQKLKMYHTRSVGNKHAMEKMEITGALSLYLDFINMFLILPRSFKRKRK